MQEHELDGKVHRTHLTNRPLKQYNTRAQLYWDGRAMLHKPNYCYLVRGTFLTHSSQ